MGKDRLDLHVLFEAAGNEPAGRRGVLEAIDDLIRSGMLEACGGDFFAVTQKGKDAIAQAQAACKAAGCGGSGLISRDRESSGGGRK